MDVPRYWRVAPGLGASRARQSRDAQERPGRGPRRYIYPDDIDILIYPGKFRLTKFRFTPMIEMIHPGFTAFIGQQRLATGPLAEVALAVMKASRKAATQP